MGVSFPPSTRMSHRCGVRVLRSRSTSVTVKSTQSPSGEMSMPPSRRIFIRSSNCMGRRCACAATGKGAASKHESSNAAAQAWRKMALPRMELSLGNRAGSKAKQPPIGFTVSSSAREVIEGALGDPDDVVADEGCTLACSIFRMLQSAFPLHDRPARKVILRQLAEDAAEVDLPVAQRAKAPGTVDPVLISAIDARSPVGIETPHPSHGRRGCAHGRCR